MLADEHIEWTLGFERSIPTRQHKHPTVPKRIDHLPVIFGVDWTNNFPPHSRVQQTDNDRRKSAENVRLKCLSDSPTSHPGESNRAMVIASKITFDRWNILPSRDFLGASPPAIETMSRKRH
jgi:hypothetical protein